MHQNAPFIPLNIKNGLPKEGGTPLLQPPPPRVLRLLVSATPFPPILAKFPSILKLIYIPELASILYYIIILLNKTQYLFWYRSYTKPSRNKNCTHHNLQYGTNIPTKPGDSTRGVYIMDQTIYILIIHKFFNHLIYN